jgi:hypothetical protein
VDGWYRRDGARALSGAEPRGVPVDRHGHVGGPLDAVAGLSGQIAGGAIPAPRFIFSGPLIDGEPPSFPNALLPIIQAAPDAGSAAQLAEECPARGAGSIKLYFRLPPESLREVIARVAGRVPVTGHLGRTRASEAVAAGINGFEHAVVTLYNDVAPEARRFDAVASSMAAWSTRRGPRSSSQG